MTKISSLLIALLTLQFGLTAQAEIIIQKGDKIAFLGDSITQAGAKTGGYCSLIIDALNKRGLEVEAKYAGILEVMGFTKEELKAIEADWANIPDTSHIRLNMKFSEAERQLLSKSAEAEGKTLQQVFEAALQNKKAELIGR